MANHSKNIFVGCGGASMINMSHMIGAFYGIERILGNVDTPVRKIFDYASQHFLQKLPLHYILTVTSMEEKKLITHGVFIGQGRNCFEEASKLSRLKNIFHLDAPLKKAVVYLNEHEFKSTWLGNKAIYRVRQAMADGGAFDSRK